MLKIPRLGPWLIPKQPLLVARVSASKPRTVELGQWAPKVNRDMTFISGRFNGFPVMASLLSEACKSLIVSICSDLADKFGFLAKSLPPGIVPVGDQAFAGVRLRAA